MAKAVLISIRPKWCEKIISGEKTIEVRKNRPKLETPFKAYIYCTAGSPELNCPHGNGKVIGEFTCDTYVTDKTFGHDAFFNAAACMSEENAATYAAGSPLYGWHISDLMIYDQPKELEDFHKECQNDLFCYRCALFNLTNKHCGNVALEVHRPPQSWCYVEDFSHAW